MYLLYISLQHLVSAQNIRVRFALPFTSTVYRYSSYIPVSNIACVFFFLLMMRYICVFISKHLRSIMFCLARRQTHMLV